MAIEPSRGLSQRIKSLGPNVSDFADELCESTEKVSQFWPAQPTHDTLHIIVKARTELEIGNAIDKCSLEGECEWVY